MNKREKALNDFISKEIASVFHELPAPISLQVQNEDIIYPDSPIIGSTAFGYILEAYFSKLLIENNKEVTKPESVTDCSYDIVVESQSMGRNIINIKVEKDGVQNNAVAAMEQFLFDFSNEDKGTLFFVLKFKYSIDAENGKVIIKGYDLYNIDQVFNGNAIKQDHRNWSQDIKNPAAGRFQVKKTDPLPEGYTTEESRKQMAILANTFKDDFLGALDKENAKEKPKGRTIAKLNKKIDRFKKIAETIIK